MKYLKIALLLSLVAALSSCVDTEEKIVLKPDNSGTYSITIDMGRMLKMAGTTLGDQSSTNVEKGNDKKDTTLWLKDLINKADNLTAREKILYKNGTVHINLDEAKDEMKIVVSSPFNNPADLTEMRNNFATVLDKLKALEKATGEKEKADSGNVDLKITAGSANPVGDQFAFTATAGKISNTLIDLAAFKKKVAEDSTLAMMSQMTGVMGDFNYRTIIVLPAAIKKHQGPASMMSGDKKTITFYTTLAEMLEHPEKVSYLVEY